MEPNNIQGMNYQAPASQPQPQPEPQPTTTNTGLPQNNSKKVGPIITVLVIVLVLVIAALYLFASQVNQKQPSVPSIPEGEILPPNTVPAVTNTDDDLQSLQNDLDQSINGIDDQAF